MPADSFKAFWQIDYMSLLLMFWHVIIFEVPRVTIATVFVGAATAVRRRRPWGPSDPSPTVTVLMAGHNEGKTLRQTVLALREQTHRPCQIVAVDDGSTDDMAAVGRRLRAEGLIDVFLSTGRRGGKVAAVNLGLGHCTGDIVLNVDIDTSFDRDAIERMIEPFNDPAVGAVSGNIAVRSFGASVVARYQAIQYLTGISLGRRVTDMLGTLFIVSGAFGAFRRHALISVGAFDMGPGEDADITIKLRRAGWKVRFQPEAWALTDVPETALALFKQRMRWNRSLVRIRLRKHGAILNPLHAGFSLVNALGTLDILLFQAALPLSFCVYVLWLLAAYGSSALLILGVVAAFYVVLQLVGFLIAASVSGHYGRLGLLPFVPGYALFNSYLLRPMMVYAYIEELLLLIPRSQCSTPRA